MAFDAGSAAGGVGGLIQLGAGIAGGLTQASFGRKEREIQQQELVTQNQIQEQRRTAMELSARRLQTENVRNAQVARSMALSAGANQGAQFGSGVASGMGQANAQAAYQNMGVSQNLQIGEKIFDLNEQLGDERTELSGLESKASESKAMYGALGALGGDASSIYKGGSGLYSWLNS